MTKGIKLGDEVEDRVTGFRGVAIARTNYLHGDTRITIQPPVDTEGRHEDSCSFEESSIKVAEKQKVETGHLKK